ncbi:type 1 fimbrial protein [Kluyvera intermedia]|uniref:fimbrial protein n=1 Tax=Kluyvera intermedia TaxID=61648 RepID=UPI001F23E7A7|nr:fimbrial protein [Kluyvera intermedia]MCE9890174.1 type 1 fimbrial protein [Kluyvera intermedia]
MKKVLFGMSMLAALVASGSALAEEAVTYGQDLSTITVRGTVTSGTCQIAVNSGAAVVLDTIETAKFVANSTPYYATPFAIEFTGCPVAVKTGTIKFVSQGTDIDAMTGYLNNSTKPENQGAPGVQVALESADSTVLKLDADSLDVTLTDGAGKLAMNAAYVATDTTKVGPGVVNSMVTFTVDYI